MHLILSFLFLFFFCYASGFSFPFHLILSIVSFPGPIFIHLPSYTLFFFFSSFFYSYHIHSLCTIYFFLSPFFFNPTFILIRHSSSYSFTLHLILFFFNPTFMFCKSRRQINPSLVCLRTPHRIRSLINRLSRGLLLPQRAHPSYFIS